MSDVIAGRYRIEREIGKGGMAIVYEALDLETHARVALKRLNPSFANDRSVVGRFQREARAVMQLKSEHAVKVLGVGATERGVPYIAMELLEGFDLACVRKQALARPVEQSVDWILQAIDAIADAHAVGIVHRDVKPHNLFVTKRGDGRELVKVLDFGIAKAVSTDGQVTRTEEIIGSPSYMSPEQTKASKDVDERTDVWALGVCLYELLTGVLPFAADSVAEIYSKILTFDPPPPTTLRPGLSGELSRVVMRCLAKERAARWADVSELAVALEPFGSAASAGAGARIKDILRARFEATAPPTPYPNAAEMTVHDEPAFVTEDPTESQLQTTVAYSKPVPIEPLPAPPPAPSRPTALYATIGGVTLVAIAGVLFAIRRPAPPAVEPAPPASVVAAPAPIESVEEEPAPMTSSSASEPKPTRTTHGPWKGPRKRPPHPAPAPAPVVAPAPPAARY